MHSVPHPEPSPARLRRAVGHAWRAPVTVVHVSTAQTLFAIALGLITLLITLFGLYVVSTTMWGNRWFRRR